MQHIHSEEHLEAGDIVIVDCSHKCNVRVMDDSNYDRYRRSSGQFQFYGGGYEYFPARIAVPHSGHWNVALDLGGGHANISCNIRYLKH